jgi:purine-binding chemotaxis protein CheW
MTTDSIPAVVVRAGGRTCALPVLRVVETMRALPVAPLPDSPAFVYGVSIIRGAPVPVVWLGGLLGGARGEPPRHFVTVRAGGRHAALAVEAVLGVVQLTSELLHELPPLLQEAGAERIEALGRLDGELLLVLRAARLAPGEVWKALADQGSTE